jgi:EAL and modified HD-GYP domain-containing signal transduction protein
MAIGTILLARQPILDAAGRVAAYELLYRGPTVDDGDIDSTTASRVLCEALATVGLERLVGEAPIFVPFSAHLLETEAAAILPRGRGVIEIAEGMDVTPALLAKLDQLRVNGLRVALDGFTSPVDRSPLLDYVDYLRIDVGDPDGHLESIVSRLKTHPVRLIGKNIETHEAFGYAERVGFDFFQGHFFARPEAVSTKRAMPNVVAVTELLIALNRADPEPATLGQLIGRDPGLAHQLLRLANSPYYGRRRLVSSLVDVVIQLGHDVVRRWASLLLLARLSAAKPPELLTIALVRARMCECIAERGPPGHSAGAFMVGLLSVLDALLDRPMQRIVAELPLSEGVRQALVGDPASSLGEILRSVIAYEQGNWAQAGQLHDLDTPSLTDCYIRALDFARAIEVRTTPGAGGLPTSPDRPM